MNRHARIALAIAAAAVALLAAGAGIAAEKLARETGAACADCHDKPGSKLLTDRGKYYEMRRTFDGFDAIQASFGRCTACHVRTPGSARLTKKGRQLADVVKDMDALRDWLREHHPAAGSR